MFRNLFLLFLFRIVLASARIQFMINVLKNRFRETLILWLAQAIAVGDGDVDAIIHRSWEMSAINRLAMLYLTGWFRLPLDRQ